MSNRTEVERGTDMHKLAEAFFDNLERSEMCYGGIGLDDKRPFGNSDVELDILEILEKPMRGDDGEGPCYSSLQRKYASELYGGLIIWLQARARRWLEIEG